MSPDQLGAALRGLVDDVEGGQAPPVAEALWVRGRRRRRTARLVPAVAAACVAGLVGLLVLPAGHPRASVPAVQIDVDGAARLTAYPDVIAKPPFLTETARPGVTAAIVPGSDQLAPVHAVSPTGVVTRVPLPLDASGLLGTPSLSPDGRWVARGPVLTDLVTGAAVPSRADQARLADARTPTTEPSWWSPDSRRVFVATFNDGVPRSAGLVVGIDGSTTEVPLVAGGVAPIVAGWLDDASLLVFLDLGPGTSRLEGRTWRVGDDAWQVSDADVEWSTVDELEAPEDEIVRASLSPDRSRVLLTRSVADPDPTGLQSTRAMMFDSSTGAQIGMPDGDGVLDSASWAPGSYVEWGGWGCRPAWRHGEPVVTDDVTIRTATASRGDPLVAVSSGYGEPCVAFSGNELRGTPVTNHVALWQERLWTWGVPILGFAVVALGLWVWSRRHQNAWRERPRWLPAIFAPPV